MKTIKHNKKANLPMYNCTFNFIVTNNLNPLIDGIYGKYGLESDFTGEAEGVVVSPDITDYYILIDVKYLSYNTIAHEIYHAVVRITEDRGISDEEAQAWLCGHLSEIVYKFLAKKNLQVKHGS